MSNDADNDVFDLIVLGTGPAGSTVAQRCARAGASVAVIESRVPGGTCALRGCNPKKVLALAAELSDWSELSQAKYHNKGRLDIHWPTLRSFTRSFTEPVEDSTREAFDADGITLLVGSACFEGPHRVRVGERTLEAKAICLAIGEVPAVPKIPGVEHAITSDDFFDLEELPDHIVFAGGGYIAMEFAHVAVRAGSQVTVVQSEERPLTEFDPSLVDELVERSRGVGIEFKLETEVAAIEPRDGEAGFAVTLKASDGTKQLGCDLVVLAAGREVDADGLDLDALGVEVDRGVIVDDNLRSPAAPHVWAAGDCAQTGRPKLTMSANLEAEQVVIGVLAALGLEISAPQLTAAADQIPALAFTSPPIARIGLDEETARERYPELEIKEDDRSSSGSVAKRGETVARYRVFIDKRTDQIVGAHFLGPGAADFINMTALAMQAGIDASQLASTIFAFPTFGSEFRGLVS